MVRRHPTFFPVVLAVLMTALSAVPVLGAKPSQPGRPAPSSPPTSPPPALEEPPLTPEQEAASAAKIAAAEAYLSTVDADGLELSSLNCVTPTGTTDLTAGGVSADATIDACWVPQGFLSVEARDQLTDIYCAPAVGQVISNYSWAVASGTNKFKQSQIAYWMLTDANQGTSAPYVEIGLEKSTAGSPRRPAGWDWIVSYLRDLNGNGDTGDELHSYLRSNVSGSRMPMAIPVKPHDPTSRYYLSSWPKAVWSPGHWIAAYGWVGYYTGSEYARLYYTDSSRNQGGSTGKFWDPTQHIARLIGEHTGRFVW
jgi:hypothetical protein